MKINRLLDSTITLTKENCSELSEKLLRDLHSNGEMRLDTRIYESAAGLQLKLMLLQHMKKDLSGAHLSVLNRLSDLIGPDDDLDFMNHYETANSDHPVKILVDKILTKDLNNVYEYLFPKTTHL